MHLPEGHRYGYIRRAHKISRLVEYKVICLCKWRDPTWHTTLRHAYYWADAIHYRQLKNAPTLLSLLASKTVTGGKYLEEGHEDDN